MEDLTGKNTVSSMWPTGQGTDAVSSPEHAMTAPGSEPAEPVTPDRSEPAPAEVHDETGDYRHTVSGDNNGGAALGWWTRAGGQEWGP
jgi:hypothetical protein